MGPQNNTEIAKTLLSQIYTQLIGELPKMKTKNPVKCRRRTERISIENERYLGKPLAVLELKEKEVYLTSLDEIYDFKKLYENKSINAIKLGPVIIYASRKKCENSDENKYRTEPNIPEICCSLNNLLEKGVVYQFTDRNGFSDPPNQNQKAKLERIEVLEYSKGDSYFDEKNIQKIVIRFCYRYS